MTTQQQREAFEAWFKNEFGRPSKPAREGASYAHPMAFSAWRAWQAAQSQKEDSEADDALAADYGKCLSMLGCDIDTGEDIPLCLSDMLDEILNPIKPAQSRFRRGIPR